MIHGKITFTNPRQPLRRVHAWVITGTDPQLVVSCAERFDEESLDWLERAVSSWGVRSEQGRVATSISNQHALRYVQYYRTDKAAKRALVKLFKAVN